MERRRVERDVDPSRLIRDMSVYPRYGGPSSHNKALIKEAIAAGITFPAVVAEASTGRLADGWHRVAAYMEMGLRVPEVYWYQYESEAELLRHAVRLNTGRGMDLSEVDKRLVTAKLVAMGVSAEAIAVDLHVTPQKVTKLAVEIAYRSNPASPTGVEIVPLKRSTMKAFGGKVLSDDEVAANRRLNVADYGHAATQLADAVQYVFPHDPPSPDTRSKLQRLQALLAEYLA